ncbi:hypothetical protein [Sinomonas halotolerans]|uniref:Core-binding (CB) domain-containing protein n=1 Tax=Sinomonas halotolerans TaxID=1644133 RepID=A0ABU9X008_9MICC
MSTEGFCRLCWRTSVGARPHGKGPSVLEANRHGQQLFIVDLFRQKRPPRPAMAEGKRRRNRYPVAHEQLTLFDIPRTAVLPDTVPPPPDPDFAATLDRAVRDHARAHGWSKTRTNATRQGLRLLAGLQDTPGAAIKASEMESLDRTAFNRLPIIDVLASAGLFVDDRTPSIASWFERKIACLPGPMSDEVRVWFDVLLHGSATPPRSRPRAEVTVRNRIRYAVPVLSIWSGTGRASLREITREDIRQVLPAQGSERSLTGQALKSLFRTLKARKLVFADPTTRIRTGRPEARFPLPIDDATFGSALESADPARALIAALVGFHALTNAQIRGLL